MPALSSLTAARRRKPAPDEAPAPASLASGSWSTTANESVEADAFPSSQPYASASSLAAPSCPPPTRSSLSGGSSRLRRSTPGEPWRETAGERMLAPDKSRFFSSVGLKKYAGGPACDADDEGACCCDPSSSIFILYCASLSLSRPSVLFLLLSLAPSPSSKLTSEPLTTPALTPADANSSIVIAVLSSVDARVVSTTPSVRAMTYDVTS